MNIESQTQLINQAAVTQSYWDNEKKLQEIKAICAPTLTTNEFILFCNIAKATNLNPFRREIWAIKYGNKEPSIFIGRDGYRTLLSRNPHYHYTIVDAVYSNDMFERDFNTGSVIHKYNLLDRGKLVGAYCLIYMHNREMPGYVFVELKEYLQQYGVWKDKPATMIKKVAESQCIRFVMPEETNGTYSPDEMPPSDENGVIRAKNPMPIQEVQNVFSSHIEQDNNLDKTTSVPFKDLKILFSATNENKNIIDDIRKLCSELRKEEGYIPSILDKINVKSIEEADMSFLAKWHNALLDQSNEIKQDKEKEQSTDPEIKLEQTERDDIIDTINWITDNKASEYAHSIFNKSIDELSINELIELRDNTYVPDSTRND